MKTLLLSIAAFATLLIVLIATDDTRVVSGTRWGNVSVEQWKQHLKNGD